MGKYAVVLMNLGGPDSLDAVEPFLVRLFSDPDIFKLPFLNKQFASLFAKLRASKVRRQYKQIGSASPINSWTETQRQMLEKAITTDYPDTEVITAMRYWHPMINLAAQKCTDEEYEKIFLLPLYPQYSMSTTGSAFNEWKRCYEGVESKSYFINEYYNNKKYIVAINQRIDEALDKFSSDAKNDLTLVFSAHGIPLSYIEKGDPYNEQINETVRLVMNARDGSNEHQICYQSKVGPVKWLEPSVTQMLEKLAAHGKKNVLMIPISFVSDHIETLYEINIFYRLIAKKLGIINFEMTEGLNDSKLFIEALKEEIIEAISQHNHEQ